MTLKTLAIAALVAFPYATQAMEAKGSSDNKAAAKEMQQVQTQEMSKQQVQQKIQIKEEAAVQTKEQAKEQIKKNEK